MTDFAQTALDAVAGRRWLGGKRLAIGLSLALIVCAAGSALYLAYSVDRQLNDVIRSYDVRDAARDLSQAVTDAETGQRGYLFTADDHYLAPYRLALDVIDQDMQRLEDMTVGDPLQSSRVQAIAADVQKKRDELTTTVALAQSGKAAQARAILSTDASERVMNDIRGGITRLLALEDERLADRNRSVAELRSMLILVIIIAMAAAAILAYALLTRSQRQVKAMSRQQSFLLSENEELEVAVKERTAELEEARAHAERERLRVETLLQESNHRIGNSLATVSSLLGLQMTRARSDEVKGALEAARGRVQVIASGHRRLRLGADLETARVDEFLEAVMDDLHTDHVAGAPIKFDVSFAPMVIKARDATTIGVVLGELVTNAIKHAFPEGRGGTIFVRFRADDNGVATLVVEDDGVGLAEGKRPESGLGSSIVKQLAYQFGGTPTVENRPEGGMRILIGLPDLETVDQAEN